MGGGNPWLEDEIAQLRSVLFSRKNPAFLTLACISCIKDLLMAHIMKTHTIIKKLPFWMCCASCFLFVLVAVGVGREQPAPVVSRDMVWSAFDGLRHEIYFSTQKKGGEWSPPLQLTDSNADNLLPCIVTMPDGKKYVVWAAMENTRLQIMYALFDGATWTEAQVVPDLPETATMPFVAANDAGELWLVFVGNDSTRHDDIYSTHLSQGGWSKPEQVNASNDVPDINPFIEIDQDGGIQVTWEGFRNTGYVLLFSRWQGDRWSMEQPIPTEDQERLQHNRKQVQEEELPDFVEDRSMLFIRTNNF
jgi:hypothetical protein